MTAVLAAKARPTVPVSTRETSRAKAGIPASSWP